MLTGLQWHDKLKEIYIGNNEITEVAKLWPMSLDWYLRFDRDFK